MTGLRNVLLAVLLLGSGGLVSTVAYAHEKGDQADIALLRDAAAALKQSRPDLAQALRAFADRETNEVEESAEGDEKEELGDADEPQEARGEPVKR